jgi:hypothetical protein
MMNESRSEKGRGTLWAGLALLAVALVLFVLKREHPTADEDVPVGNPPGPLTQECYASLQAQQKLARLAIYAMRTYGRIDPGLYDTTPLPDERALIRVSKDATPLPSPDGQPAIEGQKTAPPPVDEFEKTLREVNADPSARVFLAAHDDAQKKCGAACPPTVYRIKVTPLELGKESEAYDFRVEGAVPSLAEWEQGFLAQYANAKGSCSFASPLRLDNAQSTEALQPGSASTGGGAESERELAARRARDSKKTMSFTGGSAEVDLKCDEVVYSKQCHDCEPSPGHHGGYKKRGPGLSCCYSDCP